VKTFVLQRPFSLWAACPSDFGPPGGAVPSAVLSAEGLAKAEAPAKSETSAKAEVLAEAAPPLGVYTRNTRNKPRKH
jgi:hypothetical protein